MKGLLIVCLHVYVLHEITVLGFPQGYDLPNSYYSRLPSNDYEGRSADNYNAKFVGAGNQEDGRTFHRFHRRKFHRFQNYRPHHHSSDPCRRRRSREQEGRFFWDLNVLNVFPNLNQQHYNNDQPSNDCGGGGGGGGVSYDDYRPPNRPLFSIPISRPIPTRKPSPQQSSASSSSSTSSDSNTQNDNAGDVFDPVNDDRPVNENIPDENPPPMQLYLTPGQAVGGIASTVNAVIQTLTGNNRPGRRGGSTVQADPTTLNPGQLVGGLANTVNSVIQTLSGNGQQGGFLNSLYSGFNFF